MQKEILEAWKRVEKTFICNLEKLHATEKLVWSINLSSIRSKDQMIDEVEPTYIKYRNPVLVHIANKFHIRNQDILKMTMFCKAIPSQQGKNSPCGHPVGETLHLLCGNIHMDIVHHIEGSLQSPVRHQGTWSEQSSM